MNKFRGRIKIVEMCYLFLSAIVVLSLSSNLNITLVLFGYACGVVSAPSVGRVPVDDLVRRYNTTVLMVSVAAGIATGSIIGVIFTVALVKLFELITNGTIRLRRGILRGNIHFMIISCLIIGITMAHKSVEMSYLLSGAILGYMCAITEIFTSHRLCFRRK